jgi:DNA primase
LEEGMNVKVCAFPDGEDPDSFAKKTPLQELTQYLEDNAMDFIQFKASLLMKDAKNDPIKKADLIRDMVASISKIPDRIKREVYIQEVSRIMDISEEVLFNTLAQLVKKDIAELGKKQKEEQKAFEVVKNETQIAAPSIDIQFELEHKIIEILLIYGNVEDEFEDVILKTNEKGELQEVREMNRYKVHQRIFLSLQEDEIELANPLFKGIYNDLIAYFNQNESFELDQYLSHLPSELSQEVTTILMNDERELLHNWEAKNIFVKAKDKTISQYVTETIVTLRWFLVNKIIDELKSSIDKEAETDNAETLSLVMDYLGLTNIFSKKLGRVISRHN